MTITLSDQDKTTLRTAAYGAVTLLAWAGSSGKPGAHRIATDGSISLYTATGLVGHVLAEKANDMVLDGKSAAAIADRVLPALTASVSLLKQHDPVEADNFRSTVILAVETAAQTHKSEPSPALADMIRKITGALDAA